MSDQAFTTTLSVNQTPKQAFDAINNVRAWWTGAFEGGADNLGDEFTYRYEDLHYSRQKVVESIPGKRIVWLVLESRISFLEDKAEWTGTKITFEIDRKGDKTEVRFTHVGLVPASECYGVCTKGWGSLVQGSLRRLIATGTSELPVLSASPVAS